MSFRIVKFDKYFGITIQVKLCKILKSKQKSEAHFNKRGNTEFKSSHCTDIKLMGISIHRFQ